MSFATEQVARIETLLEENPGVKSVVDDESQPLKDAQRIRLVCKPTDKAGRSPVWA